MQHIDDNSNKINKIQVGTSVALFRCITTGQLHTDSMTENIEDLFTKDWMLKFMDEWNKDGDLAPQLSHIGFNSTIAYGFSHEEQPRGVIVVSEGRVTDAGGFKHESIDWDLRAEPEDWQSWINNPPGMMALGMAYTSGKLRFKRGDYASMIKDPRMAGPFVKSFSVMARV